MNVHEPERLVRKGTSDHRTASQTILKGDEEQTKDTKYKNAYTRAFNGLEQNDDRT